MLDLPAMIRPDLQAALDAQAERNARLGRFADDLERYLPTFRDYIQREAASSARRCGLTDEQMRAIGIDPARAQ